MEHLFWRYVVGLPRSSSPKFIAIDGSVFDLNRLPPSVLPDSHQVFLYKFCNKTLPSYVLNLPGHENLLHLLTKYCYVGDLVHLCGAATPLLGGRPRSRGRTEWSKDL